MVRTAVAGCGAFLRRGDVTRRADVSGRCLGDVDTESVVVEKLEADERATEAEDRSCATKTSQLV